MATQKPISSQNIYDTNSLTNVLTFVVASAGLGGPSVAGGPGSLGPGGLGANGGMGGAGGIAGSGGLGAGGLGGAGGAGGLGGAGGIGGAGGFGGAGGLGGAGGAGGLGGTGGIGAGGGLGGALGGTTGGLADTNGVAGGSGNSGGPAGSGGGGSSGNSGGGAEKINANDMASSLAAGIAAGIMSGGKALVGQMESSGVLDAVVTGLRSIESPNGNTNGADGGAAGNSGGSGGNSGSSGGNKNGGTGGNKGGDGNSGSGSGKGGSNASGSSGNGGGSGGGSKGGASSGDGKGSKEELGSLIATSASEAAGNAAKAGLSPQAAAKQAAEAAFHAASLFATKNGVHSGHHEETIHAIPTVTFDHLEHHDHHEPDFHMLDHHDLHYHDLHDHHDIHDHHDLHDLHDFNAIDNDFHEHHDVLEDHIPPHGMHHDIHEEVSSDHSHPPEIFGTDAMGNPAIYNLGDNGHIKMSTYNPLADNVVALGHSGHGKDVFSHDFLDALHSNPTFRETGSYQMSGIHEGMFFGGHDHGKEDDIDDDNREGLKEHEGLGGHLKHSEHDFGPHAVLSQPVKPWYSHSGHRGDDQHFFGHEKFGDVWGNQYHDFENGLRDSGHSGHSVAARHGGVKGNGDTFHDAGSFGHDGDSSHGGHSSHMGGFGNHGFGHEFNGHAESTDHGDGPTFFGREGHDTEGGFHSGGSNAGSHGFGLTGEGHGHSFMDGHGFGNEGEHHGFDHEAGEGEQRSFDESDHRDPHGFGAHDGAHEFSHESEGEPGPVGEFGAGHTSTIGGGHSFGEGEHGFSGGHGFGVGGHGFGGDGHGLLGGGLDLGGDGSHGFGGGMHDYGGEWQGFGGEGGHGLEGDGQVLGRRGHSFGGERHGWGEGGHGFGGGGGHGFGRGWHGFAGEEHGDELEGLNHGFDHMDNSGAERQRGSHHGDHEDRIPTQRFPALENRNSHHIGNSFGNMFEQNINHLNDHMWSHEQGNGRHTISDNGDFDTSQGGDGQDVSDHDSFADGRHPGADANQGEEQEIETHHLINKLTTPQGFDYPHEGEGHQFHGRDAHNERHEVFPDVNEKNSEIDLVSDSHSNIDEPENNLINNYAAHKQGIIEHFISPALGSREQFQEPEDFRSRILIERDVIGSRENNMPYRSHIYPYRVPLSPYKAAAYNHRRSYYPRKSQFIEDGYPHDNHNNCEPYVVFVPQAFSGGANSAYPTQTGQTEHRYVKEESPDYAAIQELSESLFPAKLLQFLQNKVSTPAESGRNELKQDKGINPQMIDMLQTMAQMVNAGKTSASSNVSPFLSKKPSTDAVPNTSHNMEKKPTNTTEGESREGVVPTWKETLHVNDKPESGTYLQSMIDVIASGEKSGAGISPEMISSLLMEAKENQDPQIAARLKAALLNNKPDGEKSGSAGLSLSPSSMGSPPPTKPPLGGPSKPIAPPPPLSEGEYHASEGSKYQTPTGASPAGSSTNVLSSTLSNKDPSTSFNLVGDVVTPPDIKKPPPQGSKAGPAASTPNGGGPAGSSSSSPTLPGKGGAQPGPEPKAPGAPTSTGYPQYNVPIPNAAAPLPPSYFKPPPPSKGPNPYELLISDQLFPGNYQTKKKSSNSEEKESDESESDLFNKLKAQAIQKPLQPMFDIKKVDADKRDGASAPVGRKRNSKKRHDTNKAESRTLQPKRLSDLSSRNVHGLHAPSSSMMNSDYEALPGFFRKGMELDARQQYIDRSSLGILGSLQETASDVQSARRTWGVDTDHDGGLKQPTGQTHSSRIYRDSAGGSSRRLPHLWAAKRLLHYAWKQKKGGKVVGVKDTTNDLRNEKGSGQDVSGDGDDVMDFNIRRFNIREVSQRGEKVDKNRTKLKKDERRKSHLVFIPRSYLLYDKNNMLRLPSMDSKTELDVDLPETSKKQDFPAVHDSHLVVVPVVRNDEFGMKHRNQNENLLDSVAADRRYTIPIDESNSVREFEDAIGDEMIVENSAEDGLDDSDFQTISGIHLIS